MTATLETAPMMIGGERRLAINGDTIEALNPATREPIARFPRSGADDVDAAVRAAGAAFPAWKATPPLERAAAVRAIADMVEEHADELAGLDVADNGSPVSEMRNDSGLAAFMLRYFAGLALELRGQTIPGEASRINYTLQEPYGVVGKIIPFNHPLMFAASKIAAPLVAGNTVVLKPSEHTSLSALRLAELLDGVLPPGVLNVITGYGEEAGDALVTHPDVRRLAFIGSVDIGRAIMARAASVAVKAVTLELGGKNPIVVFPDADLDEAVEGVVRGMNFTWQGQSCGSCSRVLIEDGIYDEFVERLAERMSSLRSGMPDRDETDTGAIVHERQWEKVKRYIELGRSEGARVVTGGGPPDDPELAGGMFVRPTLFSGVTPEMRLANEEIFGPVLAAMRFSGYDEALRIANGVSYGLSASVFTRDLETAHAFARDVHAGYVWVNDAARHFPGAPFGGVKDSGIGREEGIEELYSYAQPKNVNVRFASGR
jgi:betaine-aldehyde dehydrogenase